MLFIWLAVGTIPFLVLITSSKFTSAALAVNQTNGQGTGAAGQSVSWDAPETGVKIYPQVGLACWAELSEVLKLVPAGSCQ